MTARQIAVVLPSRENFSAADAGAIGLIVHRLTAAPSRFARTVIGPPQRAPFADVAYRAAARSWFPAGQARRYAGGVTAVLRTLLPALIEVHNRPDVAHFLARRFPSTPVCLFLHNDPQGMRHARTPAERAALLAHLARVVTVSGWLRGRLLESVPTPAHPPAVLPNCIDLASIPPEPPSRDSTILFAGRVVSDKGADGFVQACALALPDLPGCTAKIIGADRFGPDSPETPWLRALRPQAAAAGVIMEGYRPHAEVLAAMARASIVVVPSRWPEPFGLTALEAMAAGAPLLCSLRGGLAEIATGVAVPVDPDDAQGMADAMVTLARDPARRAVLAAAGRARAQHFALPQAASALDALRSDVLDAWSRRGDHPI
jgi:glycosyltransferase involved in cell wall biosynthesis